MPIVTFWSNDKQAIGQTVSAATAATTTIKKPKYCTGVKTSPKTKKAKIGTKALPSANIAATTDASVFLSAI